MIRISLGTCISSCINYLFLLKYYNVVMKFKKTLIVFLLSFFFLGTQSSAFAVSDTILIEHDIFSEALENVEEFEDKRNFFSSTYLSPYDILSSCAIVYNLSFSKDNYFIDLYKPPIVS